MNIAIWGTGNFGNYLYNLLKNNKNYTIKYFADSNDLLWDKKINGIKIISPQQLQKIYPLELDFVLIAFIDVNSIYEILPSMKIYKFGIVKNNVYHQHLNLKTDLETDNNIFWCNESEHAKPLMVKLETNIVDYCNLNCAGCSHFSNLFRHGEKVPFNVFCSDLQQVAKHVNIFQFDMLGGEPLADKEITDYINFTRKVLPYTKIQLISNGLLIPKQTQDFFDCCRKNDTTIVISAYKPTQSMKDKIIQILEQNHVDYIIRINKDEFGKNIDLTGMADKQEAMKRCRESRCQFLRCGKIYKCPFEALGNKFFEHYGIDIRFNGGIDIYDETTDWNTVVSNLTNKPIDACRFCSKEIKFGWRTTHSPVMEDWVV